MEQVNSKWQPHVTHEMGEAKPEAWAPSGEPRYYSVQTCKNCGGQVGRHAAGQFADEELFVECEEWEN